eukprot:955964-Prorocentrum_minimum.AAC.1
MHPAYAQIHPATHLGGDGDHSQPRPQHCLRVLLQFARRGGGRPPPEGGDSARLVLHHAVLVHRFLVGRVGKHLRR